MRRTLMVVFAAVVLLAVTVPVWAHHAFAAEFDATKPIKFKGTVTKMEWINPHAWIHIDVKGEDGKVTTWGFSAAPPGALMRRGITKENLPLGAIVNVEGSRARDGSNNASSHSVTFADGRNVFTAPGEGGR